MSRSITIEDLYAIQFLSRPRISPDGRCVAFVVTTIDEGKHEYRSSIWVKPTDGGEATRFTGGTANAHSPCWSPDGRWLAFVTDREGELTSKDAQEQKRQGKGKGQIWLIPSDGGEAHQLTFMPHGASNPTWSPDCKRMIFSAAVGPLDEETEDGKTLPKVRVIDRLMYRLDGVGFIYERRQHLFLVDVNGGEPIQLTDGDWDDKDAAWSPDGRSIAFTSSRGEDRWQLPCPDIYTLSVGEPHPDPLHVVEREKGVSRLDIERRGFETDGEQRATIKAHPSTLSHPRPYGDGAQQGVVMHQDGASAPAQQPGEKQLQDGASAPAQQPHSPRPYGGEEDGLRCLTDGTRSCFSPSWSPDGKMIAFLAKPKLRSGNHSEVFIIDATAPQAEPLCLTGEFEGGCSDWTNSDMTNEQMMPAPIWSADCQRLYILAAQRGSTRVYEVERGGAGKQPPTLTPGNMHVLDFSMDQARGIAAILIENATHVAEIFVGSASTHDELDNHSSEGPRATIKAHPSTYNHPRPYGDEAQQGVVKHQDGASAPTHQQHSPRPYVKGISTGRVEGGELRQLTHFNDELFNELELATPEFMQFAGEDGWPIDGWILKPQGFDASKKYPLVVEIHGGPNTQYGYGFMHELQMLVAQGYVVLFTNPRGSLGYGRDFALAVRGEWAMKDSLDIMAGVDAVIQKGYIDEQRLGVIGGSYGGFMTSWLIGHCDRFRAAVADRSVIDRFSFFGSSDIGWDFTDDDMEVAPWDDPERYMRMSPITYIKNIHTPVLIIHSESDLRCNIEQSEQLFAALKYLGRETLFVRFEGQSHGLSRGGHPKLRKERLRHIRAWFEKYL